MDSTLDSCYKSFQDPFFSFSLCNSQEKVQSLVVWRQSGTACQCRTTNNAFLIEYLPDNIQQVPVRVVLKESLPYKNSIQVVFFEELKYALLKQHGCSSSHFCVDNIFLLQDEPLTPEKGLPQRLTYSTMEAFHNIFLNSASCMVSHFLEPGINNGIILLHWLQKYGSGESCFPCDIAIKRIFFTIIDRAKVSKTTATIELMPTMGTLSLIAPSSQQAFFQQRKISSSSISLASTRIISQNENYRMQQPVPYIRCFFGCCLFVSLDSITPFIYDALSTNLTQLTMVRNALYDSVEIRRVTFFHLHETSALPHYFSTVKENRNKLPPNRNFATIFSIYSDTCRNLSETLTSQLCRFTFIEMNLFPVETDLKISEWIANLLEATQSPRKGFVRSTDPFSCILQDLLGGISRVLFLTSIDGAPKPQMFEVASRAFHVRDNEEQSIFVKMGIYTFPHMMNSIENSMVVRYLKKWDNLVRRLHEDRSLLHTRRALNQTCLKLTGAPLDLGEILDCLFNSYSLDIALVKCREILSKSSSKAGTPPCCDTFHGVLDDSIVHLCRDNDGIQNINIHLSKEDRSTCESSATGSHQAITPQKTEFKKTTLHNSTMPRFPLTSTQGLDATYLHQDDKHLTSYTLMVPHQLNTLHEKQTVFSENIGSTKHCAFPPQMHSDDFLFLMCSTKVDVVLDESCRTANNTQNKCVLRSRYSGLQTNPIQKLNTFTDSSVLKYNEAPLKTSSEILNCPVTLRRTLRDPIPPFKEITQVNDLKNLAQRRFTEHVVRRHLNKSGTLTGPLSLGIKGHLIEPLPCPLTRRNRT